MKIALPVARAASRSSRERAQRVVDAVLRPHHAEVGEQVALARAEATGPARTGPKRVEVGRAAHDEDVAPGALRPRSSATRRYDSLVRSRRRRGGTSARSAATRQPVERVAPAAEAREEELRDEVVVVEDEARAPTA